MTRGPAEGGLQAVAAAARDASLLCEALSIKHE